MFSMVEASSFVGSLAENVKLVAVMYGNVHGLMGTAELVEIVICSRSDKIEWDFLPIASV